MSVEKERFVVVVRLAFKEITGSDKKTRILNQMLLGTSTYFTLDEWRLNLDVLYFRLEDEGYNLKSIFPDKNRFGIWHEYLEERRKHRSSTTVDA
jgi:hypothetical protein